MIDKYEAPRLTRYGKMADIIQAGSTLLQSGDVTGDGIVDQAWDTNGDGKADVVIGGANGGKTNVTFMQRLYAAGDIVDFYDSDGDNKADMVISDFVDTPELRNILGTTNSSKPNYLMFSNGHYTSASATAAAGINWEKSDPDGGWNDPARD